MERAEFDRQRRLVDQQLTCHSIMHDKYRRLAFSMQVTLLVASLFLAALVFVSEADWKEIGLNAIAMKWTMNVLSLIVLSLSIVEIIVDWKGVARLHSEAKKRLFQLKMQYRAVLFDTLTLEQASSLSADYELTMGGLPQIPDNKFLKYKAIHKRKVCLSKQIDARPFASIWILRLKLWWNDTFTKDAEDHNNG